MMKRRESARRKSLRHFSGFPEGKAETVALPVAVFRDLIPMIDDLDELKVTLLVFARLAELRAEVAPWVTFTELSEDAAVRRAFRGKASEARLAAALDRAVERGALLSPDDPSETDPEERRYFANSPRGRAAVAAVRRGVTPGRAPEPEAEVNIFTLYEENIGPLTALLSEELMEAEETYPNAWIEEAFREAVRLNKRSWKYIHAILERWQTEGKDEVDRRPNRRDREEAARRYIEEQYRRIVEH
jgi:DnaD/phage-associated family protein